MKLSLWLRSMTWTITSNWSFSLSIRKVFSLQKELLGFTVQKLDELIEKLKDPVRFETAVRYTQDATINMYMFSAGDFGREVQKSIRYAKAQKSLKKKQPNHVIDTRPIEDVRKLFSSALDSYE